jgi:hypothetical protein
MALSSVELDVTGPKGVTTVRLSLDSGTVYTVLPPEIWKRVGLVPDGIVMFSLADGSRVERKMSQCQFRYHGGLRRYSPVVLGEPQDTALLGSSTLDSLGLVLHPFERILKPVRSVLSNVA